MIVLVRFKLAIGFLQRAGDSAPHPFEHLLLDTMATLVRSGKIRYWGMSNAPAWYVSKLATLAAMTAKPAPIALQYFYSLANRDIEDEHIPLAAEFGMAIVPWSPLAYGLLAGKYDRAAVEKGNPRAGGLPRDAASQNEVRGNEDKRLDGANPFGDTLFTEKNWQIVDLLKQLAEQTGETPARLALAWVVSRPGVTSTLIGVSKIAQINDNILALDHVFSNDHLAQLDRISSGEKRMLYSLFTEDVRQNAVFGGISVVQ